MTSGEGRRILPGVGEENVRPAVSVEIGDKDLTRANKSRHLTGDHLCGTVDVTASGLTKSDEGRTPRLAGVVVKDHIWNPVAVVVSVGYSSRIDGPIHKRVQNGCTVESVWTL